MEALLEPQRKYQLNKDMLMLRRHEKDFMLRNDLSYLEKFDRDMRLMRRDLAYIYLDQGVKRSIDTALVAYEQDFKALVSAMRQMGLNSNDGLHGEMRGSIHQVEDMLREMRRETLQLVDDAGSGTLMQIMGLSLVLILLMVALIR